MQRCNLDMQPAGHPHIQVILLCLMLVTEVANGCHPWDMGSWHALQASVWVLNGEGLFGVSITHVNI